MTELNHDKIKKFRDRASKIRQQATDLESAINDYQSTVRNYKVEKLGILVRHVIDDLNTMVYQSNDIIFEGKKA